MKGYCMFWVFMIGIAWTITITRSNAALAQISQLDFWKSHAKLVKHTFEDPDDHSALQKLLEFRDRSGIPLGFAKEVNKIVCLEGNCRKLEIWLLWNGVADYLKFELIENEPLTKIDHLEFNQEDYERLHQLLSDDESILMNIKQEELINQPDHPVEEVDGYSGATKLSLGEFLVKDAAYTCYVLWHTVYGPIQKKIRNILEEKADDSFLTLMFEQKDSSYKIWAIAFIQRNPAYFPYFNNVIMEQIKSDDDKLSSSALAFYDRKKLNSPEIQIALASLIDQFPEQRQYELIWKLEELEKIEEQTILVLLNQFAKDKIKSSLIGYVFNLIQPGNLKNPQIDASVKSLKNHKNWYVRNLTDKLLSELNRKK